MISCPNEITNIFNRFFVEIGPFVASKIPTYLKNFEQFLKNLIINSLFLHPTNDDEIVSLNNRKTLGLQIVPVHIYNVWFRSFQPKEE